MKIATVSKSTHCRRYAIEQSPILDSGKHARARERTFRQSIAIQKKVFVCGLR